MTVSTDIDNLKLDLTNELFQLDLNSDHVYNDVIELIKKIIPLDAATIYLFNPDVCLLEKVMTFEQNVEILSSLQNEKGNGLSSYSAESTKPILISDRTKKNDFNPDTDFASFLSIPILKNSILYGVLNFGSFTIDNFTKKHIKIIQKASPLLSIFLDHSMKSNKYEDLKYEYLNSIEKLNNMAKQAVSKVTIDQISEETSNVIHSINNSLSIIIGNLQCLLIGKNEFNQKSLFRLKRIESAAKKISESNNQILNLNAFVTNDENSVKI